MTNKTRPLAGLALAVAIGATIVPVHSQTPAAPDTGNETTLDTMIVTGSNIPTAEEAGPRPVQTITRAEIERSTYRTAAEILKTLPVANAGGVPISNNATGFTPGATSVSLRGLGPDATLVLINGRRVANYPIGQNGDIGFVDLNTIPAAAVDSIEILKDGASTIYGADAVAGVVNIHLRKDFEGVEINSTYGNTTNKDSSEFTSSMAFGTVTEKTRITGVVSYYHRNSIFARDRDYSRVPPFLSSNSLPGNFEISGPAAAEATGGGDPLLGASSGIAAPPDSSTGKTPAGAYRYGDGNQSFYNFNQTAGAFPEKEQYGGTFTFEHDLLKDTATLYGSGGYNYSYSRNELAPGATGNFANPSGISIVIPGRTTNPILTLIDGDTGAASQVAPGTVAGPNQFAGPGTVVNADGTVSRLAKPGAYNPNNPFNQDISGSSRFRLAEFGNRVYEDETDAVIFQGGIKGRNLPGNWGYDLSANYSRVKTTSTARVTDATKFNEILDASSGVVAVPYNPFGGRGGALNASSTIDYARAVTKDTGSSELWTTDLAINNPELIKLPGGDLGVAFGAQFRREDLGQQPDALNLAGGSVGGSTTIATNAGRKTASYYGEIRVPIVGEENKIPGVKALEVTGSFRYEEVLNTPDNVLVPSTSIRWQTFDDLTIRGTYGKGYKQPSLYQLYGPGVFSLTPVSDSNSKIQASEVNVAVLGNPDLHPEDSEAFTAGFTYTPRFIPGLTITADFFQIERSGVVVGDAQDAYNRFIKGSPLPTDNVAVFPGSSYSDNNPNNNDPNDIDTIYVQYSNAERDIVRGYDFGLEYVIPTEKYGKFTIAMNATYIDSFKTTLSDGSLPMTEVSGTDSTGTGDDGYLKWKGIGSLTYDYKSFSAVATVNFTDGFEDLDPNGIPFEVNSLTTLDLLFSYTFGKDAQEETSQTGGGYDKDGKAIASGSSELRAKPWYADTTLSLGVRNVTDEKPPFASGFAGNSNGYPGYIYSSEGRFAFVSVTKKF
ncbi:MAG: TonB-dependent receptor [Chthoniobacterales bacterium]